MLAGDGQDYVRCLLQRKANRAQLLSMPRRGPDTPMEVASSGRSDLRALVMFVMMPPNHSHRRPLYPDAVPSPDRLIAALGKGVSDGNVDVSRSFDLDAGCFDQH